MKSLIIGMGIGGLYKAVLESAGHRVYTVDTDPGKGADYVSVDSAIADHKTFDTVHICTPNYMHEALARQVASYTKIVFVEKPGVKTAQHWQQLVDDYPNTRFFMVKNNQWRSNIVDLINLAHRSETVTLNWINKNRVPNAGTWFTTKELAFGGVSRDLVPHLLSFVCVFDQDYQSAVVHNVRSQQRWSLKDLQSTDYGQVKSDGVYDVDDYAAIELTLNGRIYKITADWRSDNSDDRSITFETADGQVQEVLGLCPEEAYISMIEACFANLDNREFWYTQLQQDLWIHRLMELF